MEKFIGKWEAFEDNNLDAMFDIHGEFIYNILK